MGEGGEIRTVAWGCPLESGSRLGPNEVPDELDGACTTVPIDVDRDGDVDGSDVLIVRGLLRAVAEAGGDRAFYDASIDMDSNADVDDADFDTIVRASTPE